MLTRKIVQITNLPSSGVVTVIAAVDGPDPTRVDAAISRVYDVKGFKLPSISTSSGVVKVEEFPPDKRLMV